MLQSLYLVIFQFGPSKALERQSDEESTGNVSSDIKETLSKIKQRHERYKLDANEHVQLMGAAGASDVGEGIKKRSRSDGEEQGKRKRKRGKTTASTARVKLENLLDRLPQFLATTNQAAEAHARALSKWERNFGLVSSSDTA